MAGRGPQTFKKRQKEQQRKEKQMEKAAKRLARKEDDGRPAGSGPEIAETSVAEQLREELLNEDARAAQAP